MHIYHIRDKQCVAEWRIVPPTEQPRWNRLSHRFNVFRRKHFWKIGLCVRRSSICYPLWRFGMAASTDTSVAVLTLTLLLLYSNMQTITAQVTCDDYPCFNGGTCIRGVMGSPDSCSCPSDFIQPFCTASCRLNDSACMNGGNCTDNVCHCPSDRAPPTCQATVAAYLSPTSLTANEGQNVTIRICRQPSSSPVAALVMTSHDSAQESSDYVRIDSFIIIPAGETCQPVTIQILSDTAVESDEEFYLSVSFSPMLSTLVYIIDGHGSTNVTIKDDDGVNCTNNPCFNGGTCVRDSPDRCLCPSGFFQPFCTKDCEIMGNGACLNGGNCSNGVCQCPPDYAAPTCEAPFAAYLSPTSIRVIEGNVGERTVNVQVCRQPATREIRFRAYTRTDSAEQNFDYIPISPMPGQEVTLVEGQTCTPFEVKIVSDTIDEDNESFQFNCYSTDPEVYFVPGHESTNITIIDDDPAYIDCPVLNMPVYAGDQLSFSNTSCIFMGNSTPSTCVPSSGSRVFEDTSVTCTCDSHPKTNCTFQVFTQMSCSINKRCDDNCYCEVATCSDQSSVCSSECRTFGCPLTIISQSLSQVNPQSSVEIKCILEGSHSLPSEVNVSLSRSNDRVDTNGVGDISSSTELTDNKTESTSIVQNVSEADIFYCVLSQNSTILGSVNVTGFVYKLPFLLDPPSEVNRSTSSMTISWRSWNQDTDVGDPPVLAYIPYYKMNPSQAWINGSVITANQSLEYTASNLEADRFYTFSIVTVREGEGGDGPRGPTITIRTLCTVPPELIATSVTASITASNDVSVSWKPPENVACSTGITQFTIYYEVDGDITTRQQAGTTDATTLSFIVDGSLLNSGTTYNFYMTVTTDQEGAFSDKTSDSQLVFNIEMIMETSSFAVYLIVLVVPVLVSCSVVIPICRRYRRKTSTDTNLNTTMDANYENAGVIDDPGDYIVLDEGSGNEMRRTDQNLSQIMTHERSTPLAAVTSPKAKSQQGRERRLSSYQDVEVVRKLPGVPEVDQQSFDETEYEATDLFNEYAGVYINIHTLQKTLPPNPTKVADFENFMKRDRSEVVGEVIQQFMVLQSGKQHAWSAALKLQNKPKNFSKSLLPYDHSRVKLDTDGSVGSSDYINASYIKNHEGNVCFIAAQGPREGTKDDFWKMVWQKDIEIIVMLVDTTDITERQYWPSKVNTSLQYGDITVLLMESTEFRTHTVRKMNVLKGNSRTHTWIRHYEIPCWRYGGVPLEPVNLIHVIKQVKTHHEKNKHLLVHCSNGVGATGAFIALYDLMDIIKIKKEVSVFDVIKGMRKDRSNMVLNKLQYLFIFDALLEVMLSPDFQTSSDQLRTLDLVAIKKTSEREFQILEQSSQIERDMSVMNGVFSENKHKNRFPSLIPIDEYRPVLSSPGILFGSNDYVNATIAKDISERDFIMTQSPLPSTVEDFWRLVFDYDCSSIVMMNTIDDSDEFFTEYWPNGHNAAASHGLITVTCKQIDESVVFTKRKFQVNHKKSQKSILVDHFSFHGWTRGELDISKLRKFITYTEPIKGPGPGLIHCINGVGLSAVYVTVISELERIKKEGIIDVFGTVKRLRTKCPFAIQTEEEYCLCYKLLWDHLNNPEEYAVVF